MEKDIKSLPVLRFSGNLKYNIKDFVHVKKYDELELLKINTLCERYCQKNEDKLLAWRAISPPPNVSKVYYSNYTKDSTDSSVIN